MRIRDMVNWIGTPLIGILTATVFGMEWYIGFFIAIFPDVPLLSVVVKDLIYGKTEDRLVGRWLVLRNITHSLITPWVVMIVGLAVWGMVYPHYYNIIVVGLIWCLHLGIDYFTHDEDDKFFKSYKVFYPLEEFW